jgi:hypothetical protein
MSFISKLNLISLKEDRSNPINRSRSKLINNLQEQIKLIDNPSHCRIVGTWVKINDEKQYREKRIPVRSWCKTTLNGQIALTIRSGTKKIEFEKGKEAILIESAEKLIPTINFLIDAISAGEFDQFIANGTSVISRDKKVSLSHKK